MNRRLFAAAFFPLLGLGFIAWVVYAFGAGNSRNLWQLRRSVASVNHPPQTRRVALVSDLGLLVGNGNHCDFFVAELRDYSQTNLTARQIEAFYARTQIWNPLDEKNEKIDVATLENGVLQGSHEWEGMEQFIANQFGRDWPHSLAKQKFMCCLTLALDTIRAAISDAINNLSK